MGFLVLHFSCLLQWILWGLWWIWPSQTLARRICWTDFFFAIQNFLFLMGRDLSKGFIIVVRRHSSCSQCVCIMKCIGTFLPYLSKNLAVFFLILAFLKFSLRNQMQIQLGESISSTSLSLLAWANFCILAIPWFYVIISSFLNSLYEFFWLNQWNMVCCF